MREPVSVYSLYNKYKENQPQYTVYIINIMREPISVYSLYNKYKENQSFKDNHEWCPSMLEEIMRFQ